jgi:hypothetical protein
LKECFDRLLKHGAKIYLSLCAVNKKNILGVYGGAKLVTAVYLTLPFAVAFSYLLSTIPTDQLSTLP